MSEWADMYNSTVLVRAVSIRKESSPYKVPMKKLLLKRVKQPHTRW